MMQDKISPRYKNGKLDDITPEQYESNYQNILSWLENMKTGSFNDKEEAAHIINSVLGGSSDLFEEFTNKKSYTNFNSIIVWIITKADGSASQKIADAITMSRLKLKVSREEFADIASEAHPQKKITSEEIAALEDGKQETYPSPSEGVIRAIEHAISRHGSKKNYKKLLSLATEVMIDNIESRYGSGDISNIFKIEKFETLQSVKCDNTPPHRLSPEKILTDINNKLDGNSDDVSIVITIREYYDLKNFLDKKNSAIHLPDINLKRPNSFREAIGIFTDPSLTGISRSEFVSLVNEKLGNSEQTSTSPDKVIIHWVGKANLDDKTVNAIAEVIEDKIPKNLSKQFDKSSFKHMAQNKGEYPSKKMPDKKHRIAYLGTILQGHDKKTTPTLRVVLAMITIV